MLAWLGRVKVDCHSFKLNFPKAIFFLAHRLDSSRDRNGILPLILPCFWVNKSFKSIS